MRRLAIRAYWVSLVLIPLFLVCRLLWLASQTETGLETVGWQWRDAIYELSGSSRTPVPSQDPPDQAKFWLKEVDRILELHEGDAAMAMSAALVLDTPGVDYATRHAGAYDRPGFVMPTSLDRREMESLEEEFESLCAKRCLELAAKATSLEPSNVDWWRLRTLLLMHHSMHSESDIPRDPTWVEILDQCAKHDPDNALYDYFAAHFYWNVSAKMNYSGSDSRVVVTNPELFQRGVDCFERGQKKSLFVTGEAPTALILKFLADTNMPLVDRERIANSRFVQIRRQLLLHELLRPRRARLDETIAAGDVMAALKMGRQDLRVVDQYVAAGPSATYDSIAIAHRVVGTSRISTLVNGHKDHFSPEKLEAFDAATKDARLTRSVLEQVGRDLAASRPRRPKAKPFAGIPLDVVHELVVSRLPPLVVVLSLVAMVAGAMSWVSRNRELPKVRPVWQFLSLVVACAVTVFFFGLAPAKLIPHQVQAWTLTILLFLPPLALVTWVAWIWLRFHEYRFSLRGMLITTLIASMVIAWITLKRLDDPSFLKLPFALAIPPRGWTNLDAETFENVVRSHGKTYWTILQWLAYYGPFLTLAIWVVLSAIQLHLKMRYQKVQAERQPLSFRDYLGAQALSIAKASITLSAVMICAYALLAPKAVTDIQRAFEPKIEFARNPGNHWSRVEAAVQRIRDNPERMAQLEHAVEAGMSDVRNVEPES